MAPPDAEIEAGQKLLPEDGGKSTVAEGARPSNELLVGVFLVALVTKLFTNLEAIPGMSTISMLCCCLLAEWLEQLWAFLLCLVPVGIMLGLSTWGYLQVSALAICVALQIPLTIAYLAHRWLTQRHPELWSVTLAFPCINTALWVLSFFFLPIGSIASPAYDLAGQSLLLTQCSAWFGRSGVTFILSWLAAAGAHRCANSKATGAPSGYGTAEQIVFNLNYAKYQRAAAPPTLERKNGWRLAGVLRSRKNQHSIYLGVETAQNSTNHGRKNMFGTETALHPASNKGSRSGEVVST